MAVLLLHTELVLPLVLQAPTAKVVTAVCQGDHEKCGCSPARVAAKTCCCVISSLPPCCQKKALEKEQSRRLRVAVPPCGTQELTTLVKVAPYMLAAFTTPKIYAVAWLYPLSTAAELADRFMEPPTPPPQILALS